jgi:hypothetical protein
MVPALTNCCLFSSGTRNMNFHQWPNRWGGVGNRVLNAPEWVILSSAPVAFRCPRISLDRASRVRGTRAPDLAIFVLLSSTRETQLPAHSTRASEAIPCVARLVTHPTALHCTSTLGLSIWRMRGSSPPNLTISSLFSASPGLSAEKNHEA